MVGSHWRFSSRSLCMITFPEHRVPLENMCILCFHVWVFQSIYKYNVWCLMEVINYSHKEIPPSWKLQSFLLCKYELQGGFCRSRVSFGSAQLLQWVCFFFFMWYSLSCSIKELVKQRLLYLILRVYRFLCLAWRLGCAHVFLVLLVSGQRLQHFWCSPYRTPWAIRLDVQEFLLKYGELYRLVDFNPI